MEIELKVPAVGESIQEVMIAEWLKAPGDSVAVDEPLVVLETDKATVELPAPSAGTLKTQIKGAGQEAVIGEVIGLLLAGSETESQEPAPAPAPPPTNEPAGTATPPLSTAPAPHAHLSPEPIQEEPSQPEDPTPPPFVMPAAKRLIEEYDLDLSKIEATGPGNRLLKEDVQAFIEETDAKPAKKPGATPAGPAEAIPPTPILPPPSAAAAVEEEVVPMSPLRRRIAERLVEAQKTAALLTTFNEVDMFAVSNLRKKYQEQFQKQYGVKLGFMSFFVKAAIEALKAYPAVNAEIRDRSMVFKNHYDIGIAIGGGKGLVVPVLRNADEMSFAEVEKAIAEFAKRARENSITLEELKGGTFTITNGGVYGSMLSTPIVNPPQSAILGMHAIQDRPVAINGEVVIRPMMYIALTYDHRIIDGREAVSFLRRIKETVEEPARMLIEV
jgi:2-oxoglutarate dehydrogenase E2 component (dihydrolipoamide succinyltransferase)